MCRCIHVCVGVYMYVYAYIYVQNNALFMHRFFRHEMRHLSLLSQSLDSGNICPACPKVGFCFIQQESLDMHFQDSGKVVYALDALFGLPRKKFAGISHREPLH